jgi:branched-subunit amino acid transport protein
MSSQTVWLTIAGAAVVTFAIKAIGPIALGGRELPPAMTRVIAMMSPALLAALIATNALANGQELAIGSDTAGVAAAGLLVWRTGSVIGAVVIAAVVTALLRGL